MAKKIIYGEESRKFLKDGVDTVVNAVKVTLGPKGRNVAIKENGMMPFWTKDGVTVARHCRIGDPLLITGAEAIIDLAMKQLMDVGDSTTTTCVLAQAIIEEGMKLIEAGANPLQLQREINEAVASVVKHIESLAIPVSGDMLEHVATIAANNDNAIGKLVAEAFNKIGKEGVVTLVESHTAQTRIEVVQGMQFNRGYLTPFCVNNPAKMNCELDNVKIFIYDKVISQAKELFGVMSLGIQGVNQGCSLLMIVSGLEGEAMGAFTSNKVKTPGLPVCIVECPEMRDSPDREQVLMDISILTNAMIIGDLHGEAIAAINPTQLGGAAKVTVTESTTAIIGGQGDKKLVDKRLMELRTQAGNATGIKLQGLETRIARLSSGVAVMYVGGNSQVEMKERKDRCDDAIRATKAALQEGIVAGGGICLFKEMERIGDKNDLTQGEELLVQVLASPLEQICLNAGIDPQAVLSRLFDTSPKEGYNAATGEFVDMVEAGIIDPAKVVRCALQNAASIAGMLLTSECLMVEIPEEPVNR